MSMALPWPEAVDRVVLDEVDSTMAEAARRAEDFARPVWIMARRQTAARGRRGRAWSNPDGNFSATFLFRPEGPASEAALRSFSMSLALFKALSGAVSPTRLALKWPNDVLLNGGKVAGILLESTGIRDRLDWLAIGVGVNLVQVPPTAVDAVFAPVSLASEGGGPMGAEELLSVLAVNMAAEERRFAAQGFGPIRAEWLQHAARLGEVITARTARETFTGTFETVDEDGQLVLRTASGQVSIPAADVYF